MSALGSDVWHGRHRRMNKRKITTVAKVIAYSVAIIVLSCMLYFKEGRLQTLKLRYCLKWGTPSQKEAVLDLFRFQPRRALVPSVIDAIMDNTALPMHGDTGWGWVHFQAAFVMCQFAQLVDGKTPEQRGLQQYSFHNSVGPVSAERRKEVRQNWRGWYAENKNARMAYNRTRGVSGWRSRYENHLHLGQIYVRIGDHRAAQKEYEQIIENTSPVSQMGDELVYFHIVALILLNRDEEAVVLLSKAEQRFANSELIRWLSANYDEVVQSCDAYRVRR
jgi:tetratricopeptide (TPR) repeat protein